MPVPAEILVELVARNPGRTTRELVRLLAQQGWSDLSKSQLNSALYNHPRLRVEKITDNRRLWYVRDSADGASSSTETKQLPLPDDRQS